MPGPRRERGAFPPVCVSTPVLAAPDIPACFEQWISCSLYTRSRVYSSLPVASNNRWNDKNDDEGGGLGQQYHTRTCASVPKLSGLFSAPFGPFPPIFFPLMYMCQHDSAPPSSDELTPLPAASLLMLAITDSAIDLCWSGRLTRGSKMDPTSGAAAAAAVLKGLWRQETGGRRRSPLRPGNHLLHKNVSQEENPQLHVNDVSC